jgi:hypothetical protein
MAKIKVSKAQRELFEQVKQLFHDFNKYRVDEDEFCKKLAGFIKTYAGLYLQDEAMQEAWVKTMESALGAYRIENQEGRGYAFSPNHPRSFLTKFDPETLTGGLQV